MAILVTGGAGFIGSHLVERLLEHGNHVICLDDFNDYYPPPIKERNLKSCSGHPRFQLVRGDIRQPSDVERAFAAQSIEAVVHLAARAGVRPSLRDPSLYCDVNVTGTTHILEACRRFGVPRLLMASSSSVYGGRSEAPFREDAPVDEPFSPYAATKKATEVIGYSFHHLYGLSVGCLRFFTVYGPRQRPDMAIHKFARAILDGREITLYGDGSSRRDYTYVGDIVNGILAGLTTPFGYEIFNLGNSHTVSLSELIDELEQALGRRARRRYVPDQPGDVPITFAEISKARALLGYNPEISLQAGLRRFAEWLRQADQHHRLRLASVDLSADHRVVGAGGADADRPGSESTALTAGSRLEPATSRPATHAE